MAFRSMIVGTLALAVSGMGAAQAQTPFPPMGPQGAPFPPAGQAPFFGQPQEPPPCVKEFLKLREEREKRLEAAQAVMTKKTTATEVCQLLTKLTQSEASLLKFVQKNSGGACPFPPELPDNIKTSYVRTEGFRKQACTVAAGPPKRTEPTLSDALSAPSVGKDNTKTGSGTLDSLYGNPLAR